MKRKVFNVFCFVIIFCQLFFLCTNTAKSSTLVHGTAKFKDNIVTLQLFNDNDSDVYVFDSYFKEGLSNSKWFYRWDRHRSLLKLSFVPLYIHLGYTESDLIRLPYVIDKELNDSYLVRTKMHFDSIPPKSTKKYSFITQNFKLISKVIEDRDSISLYDITASKFLYLSQAKNQVWYLELAIYSSINYINHFIKRTANIPENYALSQLIGYQPLLIKIEMD
ncbi:MAG: hypothetical protein MR656_07140 [Bacteroidales bacterium]|nr:hypothetical protein [Bacteroidales bacterium]MCI6577856.1 hypothetical protein [Bacteroidales bacterium]MDY2671550.1 hypothetical protein [Sodaliphilus sp.]MDY3735795.1 hypothetical protein [Sodaliphilus sp.]MDY4780922.1 hypothetical protein [Sodaliphilus sp.]